jgi:hypothetical protein
MTSMWGYVCLFIDRRVSGSVFAEFLAGITMETNTMAETCRLISVSLC